MRKQRSQIPEGEQSVTTLNSKPSVLGDKKRTRNTSTEDSKESNQIDKPTLNSYIDLIENRVNSNKKSLKEL